MNWVRLLIVVVVVGALVVFAIFNSQLVEIDLGFGEIRPVWLPLVVLISFMLGFVPVYLWMSAERLLLKRKISKLEQGAAHLEGQLSQARVELLQPTAPQAQTVLLPAPPPGT